jgi:hypothetical protein
MDDINPKWDDFILWLALPESSRTDIVSENQWAKANGLSDSRTLRRWKQDVRFQKRQLQLTEAIVNKNAVKAIMDNVANPSVMAADEVDYQVIKAEIIEKAKAGNLKSQEMFMKLYGKTWLDEEQAARSSDFSNMDLEVLVATAAAKLAPEVLVTVLKQNGYQVYSPEGELV